MAPFDPLTWSVADWLLHAWGLAYLTMFVVYAIKLPPMHKAALAGDREARARFNEIVSRMPGRAWCKMFGLGPLPEGKGSQELQRK